MACDLSSPNAASLEIRQRGSEWAVFDGVGQFGGWVYIQSSGDAMRVVRYDEAAW